MRTLHPTPASSRVGILSLVALLLLPVPASLRAEEAPSRNPAPTGFGPVRFGMKEAEARQALPDLEVAPALPGPLAHADLRRLVRMAEKVPGLQEKVDLELRFWKGRLWAIYVYASRNSPETLRGYLEKEFGAPSAAGDDPVWVWPEVSIVGHPRQGWFSLSDKELGREAQRQLTARPEAGKP